MSHETTNSDETRRMQTIQAPPADGEEPVPDTNRGKDLPPGFVGQPPRLIPSAPGWANALFGELQGWQKANRESIHDLRNEVQRVSANIAILANEFERYSNEMRERVNWQEAELIKHRKAIAGLQGDVAELDRRLSILEPDGK